VPTSGRQSIVFFHQPNPDLIVEPLPSCVEDQHEARYQPMRCADHIMAKELRYDRVVQQQTSRV
jgi:isopenicillin N synthase-like dioxygenase